MGRNRKRRRNRDEDENAIELHGQRQGAMKKVQAAPAQNALAPHQLIQGKSLRYAVGGGTVYDLSDKKTRAPMITGMISYEVPTDREAIMKAFDWGWNEAKKEIEDIAKSGMPPGMMAKSVSGLLQGASTYLIYATDIEGYTKYVHDTGYKLGLNHTLLLHPEIMAHMPHAGIAGQAGKQLEVQDAMASQELPFG